MSERASAQLGRRKSSLDGRPAAARGRRRRRRRKTAGSLQDKEKETSCLLMPIGNDCMKKYGSVGKEE